MSIPYIEFSLSFTFLQALEYSTIVTSLTNEGLRWDTASVSSNHESFTESFRFVIYSLAQPCSYQTKVQNNHNTTHICHVFEQKHANMQLNFTGNNRRW